MTPKGCAEAMNKYDTISWRYCTGVNNKKPVPDKLYPWFAKCWEYNDGEKHVILNLNHYKFLYILTLLKNKIDLNFWFDTFNIFNQIVQ